MLQPLTSNDMKTIPETKKSLCFCTPCKNQCTRIDHNDGHKTWCKSIGLLNKHVNTTCLLNTHFFIPVCCSESKSVKHKFFKFLERVLFQQFDKTLVPFNTTPVYKSFQ